MKFDWQTATALGIVAIAVAFLARRWLGVWRQSKPGCGGGGCSSCAPKNETNDRERKPLVSISLDSIRKE